MNSPQTMTSADFKTAVEALGLGHPYVASVLGLSVQRVFLFGTSQRLIDVPQYVADTLLAMSRDFELAADRLAGELEAAESEDCLTRHTTPESYWAAVPELQGWPIESQSMLLAEVQRRLTRPIHIEYALTADAA